MIYDFDTELTITPPITTGHVSYSSGVYDLRGGNDGVPQLLGGTQLYVQFEVTTAFVVDGGAPLAQFGLALGDTDPLDSGAVVLAMTGGSIITKVGLDFAQLSATARTFHLAIPPFDDIMQADGALWPDTNTTATLATFRDMRYLGLVCVNPMNVSSDNEWVAGEVKGRICTHADLRAVGASSFPTRMVVI